jgi:hypothetical protein
MKEEEGSSVWASYKEAKRNAFERQESPSVEEVPLTIEELELAIAMTAASSGVPETGMPPRATVHPSGRGRWSRWFYRALVVLFSALVATLLWWGYKIIPQK